MKIINKTKWSTAHLRAIAKRVADDYLEPNQRKRLTITFIPSRKWVSGCANVGKIRSKTQSLHSTIRMPNRFTEEHPEFRTLTHEGRYHKPGSAPLRASIANVIAHELSHNAGRRGERSMRGNHSRLGWASVHRGDWDWAEAMPLEIADQTAKRKKRGSDESELARIESSLKRWKTKAKRAQTYVQKLEKKKRYYEQKMARRANTS